jgi:hypothetical protein
VGYPSGMDSWYDIVKSYDDPKSKDPDRKDDGTYSKSSVVILLIYLTFGEDYPYHIASFFKKITSESDTKYSSNLRNQKVGTLLNKMNEDELVLVTENEVRGRHRKTYSINPKIIQSPIRGQSCFKLDDPAFEIPLDLIKQFLKWLENSNEANKQRNAIFENLFTPNIFDYFTFIGFIQIRTSNWDKLTPVIVYLTRKFINNNSINMKFCNDKIEKICTLAIYRKDKLSLMILDYIKALIEQVDDGPILRDRIRLFYHASSMQNNVQLVSEWDWIKSAGKTK